jgi:hypothetical protein
MLDDKNKAVEEKAADNDNIKGLVFLSNQITIDEDDVNLAVRKLSCYKDHYSTGIVAVFERYLKHKNFNQMRQELEEIPQSDSPQFDLPPDLLWDINTNMIFLEVIYPVTEKGGVHHGQ